MLNQNRTSKNAKKSTFSHHDMIYFNGKLKACALRICNCFLSLKVILRSFKGHLEVTHKTTTKCGDCGVLWCFLPMYCCDTFWGAALESSRS